MLSFPFWTGEWNNNNNNYYYYYSYRPSAQSLTMAPRFLHPVTHVLPLPASFSYWAIWRFSSALRLSIYTSVFQWAFFLRNFFSQYSIRDPFCRISLLLSQLILISSHACTLCSKKKSIGLKFSKSQTGSHVTYSCHDNTCRFTFPTCVHSWRFSVIHSLQSITPRIY